MSSNINIVRICQLCRKEFIAKKTVTKYCGLSCARKAYKVKIREDSISKSNTETDKVRSESTLKLQNKKFLTVGEMAEILSISRRSAYLYVSTGKIPSVNFGDRCIRISAEVVDTIFKEKSEKVVSHSTLQVKDLYSLADLRVIFGLSDSTLRSLLKRNNITPIKKGRSCYAYKSIIEDLLKK
jgi:excisionase family DNA binding protein